METEESLLLVGLCPVSAITQEPSENAIAFLEKLKEALQKFTDLDLDSYEGQVILKDKFLSQCTTNIRIKFQQLQQQDSAASLDEIDGPDRHQYLLYQRTGEAKAQEREKSKETRHAQMLNILQGSP